MRFRFDSNYIENTGLNYLASMSLLVLPMKATQAYTMSFELTNRNGSHITNIVRKGEQELYLELFLVFVMPFRWPFFEENDLYIKFIRQGVLEIYNGIQKYEKESGTSILGPEIFWAEYFRKLHLA